MGQIHTRCPTSTGSVQSWHKEYFSLFVSVDVSVGLSVDVSVVVDAGLTGKVSVGVVCCSSSVCLCWGSFQWLWQSLTMKILPVVIIFISDVSVGVSGDEAAGVAVVDYGNPISCNKFQWLVS